MKRNVKIIVIGVCLILVAAIVASAIWMSPSGSSSYNESKVFRMIDTWEKSTIVNHYHGGSNVGPLEYFAVEGLYRSVRSSTEIIPVLAEGKMEHVDELTSIIRIRQNAKWQNGDDFVAQDVLAFYWLNHTEATNYMLDITAEDDKTLKISWNPNRLVADSVKEYLVAQDRQGTVQYAEFKGYADTAKAILDASPEIAPDSTTWGAFNRFSTTSQIAALNANYSDFTKHNPNWFVCTGPFRLDSVTPTQMILKKNSLHWNAQNIEFEQIEAYTSSDLNQSYNMLANNEVDYVEGMAPIDTLEAVLAQNKNLVHIKMMDTGTTGLTFNMENPIWTPKVREAFQYLFDREEIKNIGNPYAITSWTAGCGASPLELEQWISAEHFAMIKEYSYDQQKAAELLAEAGWEKKGDGWYCDGKKIKLYLGADSENAIQSAAADSVEAALNGFGIECVVKKSDHNNFNANAYADNSPYDMMLFYTSLNLGFSYPSGYFKQFETVYSRQMHLPRYPASLLNEDGTNSHVANMTNLQFKYLGEGKDTIDFASYVNYLYALDDEEFERVVASIAVGLSEYRYGVNLFHNVTGGFFNTAMIDGLPLEEYWSEDRNVSYVPPVGSEEGNAVAKLNKWFGGGIAITTDMLKPTGEEQE